MKNRFVGQVVAIVLAMAAHAAGAVEGDTKITLCKYCNSSAFSNAAETAAMQQSPQLQEGRQFVFVVDVGTDEIRYYEVVRESVRICREDAATAQSSMIIDPDDPGPTLPDCFSNWVTSSTQLAPPAAALAELQLAREQVRKFVAEVQDHELGDLDFGGVDLPIDSAVDLLGNSTFGHDTAFLRSALEGAVANVFFETWTDRVISALLDLGARFANTFLADPSILNLNSATVHFPDGTSIELDVVAIVRDELSRFKTVRLKVNEASARGTDGSVIPTTPGAFGTAFGNPGVGNPMYLSNLSDLFVRGGGRVDREETGNSCSALMQCWEAGVDANGNPILKCRLVLPKRELRC